jgi:hypothetical protein
MRAHWSPPGRLSKPAGSKSLGGIFFSRRPAFVIKKNTAAPLFDIDRLGKLHQTLFRITWDFPARKPPDAALTDRFETFSERKLDEKNWPG